MKWEKRGQIFNTAGQVLPKNCVGFAQSPQTLIFDTFVRIYFSTRSLDASGKYLSHVAFVDFDKQFRQIGDVAARPVIPLGELGCFDEHGIFPFNVVKHGPDILAYTTGWNRRVSVSTDAAIGLATSQDNGLTFQKSGQGPVLSASLHEPFLVGDAFVRYFEGTYHMWYIFGTRWATHPQGTAPDRIYKIAHAVSTDGKAWAKEGRLIVADKLNSDECQALPSVVKIDSLYHMFFCYREAFDFRTNPTRSYRIGHAFSADLVNWTRDDGYAELTPSVNDWDSDMQCYPHVFEFDQNIYLLYNGNEFGRYGFGLAKLEK